MTTGIQKQKKKQGFDAGRHRRVLKSKYSMLTGFQKQGFDDNRVPKKHGFDAGKHRRELNGKDSMSTDIERCIFYDTEHC